MVGDCPGFALVPEVDMDGEGGFVVAWECDGYFVQARVFDALGTATGPAILVNDIIAEGVKANDPAVTAYDSGGFVVAWCDNRNDPTPEDSDWDIYLQMFDKSGSRVGGNIRVNDDVAGADQLFQATPIARL